MHVISVDEVSRRGAALGAFAYLEKPVSQEALEGAFEHITTFLDRPVRKLLLVEDDDTQRQTIVELVGEGDDVQVTAVRDRRGSRWPRSTARSSTAWSSTWCCRATTASS